MGFRKSSYKKNECFDGQKIASRLDRDNTVYHITIQVA